MELNVPEDPLRKIIHLSLPAVALVCSVSLLEPAQAKSGKEPATNEVSQISLTEQTRLIVPWDEMNSQFRKIYATARTDALQSLGPIVVLKEDKIILRNKGEEKVVTIITPQYHLFKSMAHIPLTIFCKLVYKADSKLTSEDLGELQTFKESFMAASKNLNEWKLSEGLLQKQWNIINPSRDFIDKVVKDGTVSKQSLQDFCRDMGPKCLDNANYSMSIEMSNVDKAVKDWKKELGEEDWRRLRVIIMAPHMPRNEERVMQYFFKHMKEKKEGHGIVYAENATSDEYARDLLGTHVLDREMGVNFFNDPWRMHRDLLSDAARLYLKKHKIEMQ